MGRMVRDGACLLAVPKKFVRPIIALDQYPSSRLAVPMQSGAGPLRVIARGMAGESVGNPRRLEGPAQWLGAIILHN